MTRRQRFILLIGFTLAVNAVVLAQPTLTPPPADVATGRIFTLYGDLRVLELEGNVPATTMYDLILYSRENEAVARQRVGKGGRCSFNNIIEGNYLIAVELDNVEIARVVWIPYFVVSDRVKRTFCTMSVAQEARRLRHAL